jgi:hypothetical protein
MFTPGQKIARFDDGDLFVSTILANDTGKYETGISHEVYNPKIVIVEEYETEEQAIAGHAKWLKVMQENPAKELTDVSSALIAQLLSMVQGMANPPGDPSLN